MKNYILIATLLDPGVRTFQTIYSEEKVVKIKTNKELVNKLKNKLDLMARQEVNKEIFL